MMTAANIVLASWGFLIGFVGWASCIRLIEPISSWLSRLRPTATAAALLTRLIVTLFLIAAIMSAIAIGPLIMIAAGGSAYRENSDWRSLLGVAFMGSLVGLVVQGALQRFWGRDLNTEP